MPRVLFVCLGNICRSPIGEGYFRHHAARAKCAEQFEIDSAGLGAWHVGEPPDARAIEAAGERGIDLSTQRARKVAPADFERFDRVIAMDRAVLDSLRRACPSRHAAKLQLLRAYDPQGGFDVPDPYTGSMKDFQEVCRIVERCVPRLLASLREAPPQAAT